MAETPQEIVRAGDKDLFLATLFCPPASQADLFALYAFQIEVSRIPRLVSEPQIGEIRLQWWRDAVETIAQGAPQDHPVLRGLQDIITRHLLPTQHLVDFIEARRQDLYADRFPDLIALEAYLGLTQSAFFQLAAMIMAPAQSHRTADAAGLGGVAFALSRDLATSADKCVPVGMEKTILVAHARKRLHEARAAINALPKDVFPVFLPVAVSELYLDADSQPLQWRRQWKLWRAARRESI